jgi:hypothetical protein
MMAYGIRLTASAAVFLLLAASGCSHFSSTVQAQNPSAQPLEFVGQWGVKGDGPGQLDDPEGISTDSVGNVYIPDAGSRFVHKFAPNGTPLLSFQDDSVKEPQSIAVDYGGAIYVTDPSRGSVFVFLPDDEHEHHRQLRLSTKASTENSLSVAVDDDGVIYVFDENAGKAFSFSPRFRMQRSWMAVAGSSSVPETKSAKDKKDRRPEAATGPLQLGGDGNLYVADAAANRLLRFSTEGRFLAGLAPSSAPADPKISDQFAVSRNYIFVMDTNGLMLHVWALDGSPKLDLDLSDKLGRTHRLPPALAVSPRRELFILDAPARRVLRYHINF